MAQIASRNHVSSYRTARSALLAFRPSLVSPYVTGGRIAVKRRESGSFQFSLVQSRCPHRPTDRLARADFPCVRPQSQDRTRLTSVGPAWFGPPTAKRRSPSGCCAASLVEVLWTPDRRVTTGRFHETDLSRSSSLRRDAFRWLRAVLTARFNCISGVPRGKYETRTRGPCR